MVNQIGGGDKWIVNGLIQPKMSVRRRKYRFRILNTGPAKTWTLKVVGPTGAQTPWTIVAVDANFLRNPWVISNADLTVFVASRYDVIIDFKQFPVGSKVYLRENAAQNVGVARRAVAGGLADRERSDALRRGRGSLPSRHAADSEHTGQLACYSDS